MGLILSTVQAMRSTAACALLLLFCLDLSDAFAPHLSLLRSSEHALKIRWPSALRQCSMSNGATGEEIVKNDGMKSSASRRSALLAGVAAAVLPPLQNAFAAETATPAAPAAPAGYVDAERGFSFTPPAGWNKGTATFPGADRNPARPEIISYVSPDNKDVNLAVVSYSIQPDYSKLGSLGTIDDVARTILGTSGNLDAEMFSQKEK